MNMEIEVIQPQREPLYIPVNLDGAPDEVVEVVQAIKKVAEKVLYHWGLFPIVLPPPLAVDYCDGDGANKKHKPLNVRDLFIAPTFEELNVVSVNSKGDPQLLTEKQIQSIAETGEFEVESMNFPGQVHIWQLSQLLQKGRLRTYNAFLQDVALALQLIVVTAKNRLFSHFFSISESIRAFFHGLALLLDAFIGIPSLSAKNLEVRIQEERSKYLVAELTVRSNLEDDIDNLCQFVKHQIRRQTMEKYRFENEKTPPVIYLYQTPKGHDIDLRLFNKEIIRKSLPIIASILEKESRGWFLQFREKIIAELKTKKISDEDVERQANNLVLDEYLKRVFHSLINHKFIHELGVGIGSLLVEQAQAVVLMHRAVDNMHKRLAQMLSQLKTCITDSYPVLSLIKPWLEEKLKIAEDGFILDHKWDPHEEALALCRQHCLDQTCYFLQRDLTFMREREPVLKQELGRVQNPNRSFHWSTQIWYPHHWKVRKVFQGESEIVPTVISQTPSSLAQPRSDPNQPVFLVEKQILYTTTTRTVFWRWLNYVFRTFSWLCNAMFLFGVVIPWCSPVSLRALFSIRPFKPDLELNQLDGILYPRKTSATHTVCSRLILLWRHISKSRTEFESRPDTGFIGKGFSRHLNRVWNYVLKGVLGTVLIVLLFPITCLLASCLSLCIAFSAPLWVPCCTFLFHLLMLLVFDFDCPNFSRNKFCILLEAMFWHIFVLGFIQSSIALLVACLLCPIASLVVVLFGVCRYGLRLVWDSGMFHILIKRRGRVPASDSFLVKRIAGPGLSNDHYFQIQPEQALAAFEAKLETEELNAFRDEVERIILLPQQTFSEFVGQCFHPFSAALSKEGLYLQLEKEAQELLTCLRDHVDRRKKELQTGLSVNMRSKIKLPACDLQMVLKRAMIMCEQFYPSHVFKRQQAKDEIFWEKKGLPNSDWLGLAAQLFTEIFSVDFLTPLEEGDTRYQLEVQGANLQRYSNMLQPSDAVVDVDVGRMIHTPKGKIHVHSPYLDLCTFNPLYLVSNTVHKSGEKKFHHLWKAKKVKNPHLKKLLIPLPLPHPVQISVIIFNRENEEPISTESDVCIEVLKVISEGSRSSAIMSYDIEDRSMDDQSFATTMDDYRGAVSDIDNSTVASQDDRGSHSTLGGSMSQNQLSDGSVIVNLASTEDISLETDGQRVTYSHSSYSTSV